MDDEQNEKETLGEIQQKAGFIDEDDVKRCAGREQEFKQRVGSVPGRLQRFIRQVGLLFELVRAYADGSYRRVPFGSIAMAVVAIGYFLSPVDAIPDAIPVVGYVDDALVVGLVITAIQEDLRNYCADRGYDPDEYFR